MKHLLEMMIVKIDKIDDRLDSIDKTIVKQEVNLAEHMRRTELLESQHQILKESFEKQIEPLKKHEQGVKAITKFIVIATPILCTVAGLIYKYLT